MCMFCNLLAITSQRTQVTTSGILALSSHVQASFNQHQWLICSTELCLASILRSTELLYSFPKLQHHHYTACSCSHGELLL